MRSIVIEIWDFMVMTYCSHVSLSISMLITRELLQTEESYVESLNVLNDVYMKSLSEVLSTQESRSIFSTIETIRLHSIHFRDRLKETIDANADFSTVFIGPVVNELAAFFKVCWYSNSHVFMIGIFTV